MPTTLTVNGTSQTLDLPDAMPLLWALREGLNLTGTKFGCGIASCGACTVHLNGDAVRSCQVALSDAAGAEVVTIEGLGNPAALHAVQAAWIEGQVRAVRILPVGPDYAGRCAAVRHPDPTEAEIDMAMEGNLCRCGTYPRIRAAVKDAAKRLKGV